MIVDLIGVILCVLWQGLVSIEWIVEVFGVDVVSLFGQLLNVYVL